MGRVFLSFVTHVGSDPLLGVYLKDHLSKPKTVSLDSRPPTEDLPCPSPGMEKHWPGPVFLQWCSGEHCSYELLCEKRLLRSKMFRKLAELHHTLGYYINKHKAENQQRNLFKSIEPKFLKHTWPQTSSPLLPHNAHQQPEGGFSMDNALGKTGIQEPQEILGLPRNSVSLNSEAVWPKTVALRAWTQAQPYVETFLEIQILKLSSAPANQKL